MAGLTNDLLQCIIRNARSAQESENIKITQMFVSEGSKFEHQFYQSVLALQNDEDLSTAVKCRDDEQVFRISFREDVMEFCGQSYSHSRKPSSIFSILS